MRVLLSAVERHIQDGDDVRAPVGRRCVLRRSRVQDRHPRRPAEATRHTQHTPVDRHASFYAAF